MPTFIVRYLHHSKRWRAEIDDATIVVGRGKDAQLRLPHSAISDPHFEIVSRGDRHVLRDLGSTNGTRLNGLPIERAALSHGDLVQVGPFTIEVRLRGDALPPKPESAEATAPERKEAPPPRAGPADETETVAATELADEFPEVTADETVVHASATSPEKPTDEAIPTTPSALDATSAPRPRARTESGRAAPLRERRPPRQWNSAVLIAAAVCAVLGGIGLGYVGRGLDATGTNPDDRAGARDNKANSGLSASSRDRKRGARPENPLGPPITRDVASDWYRSIVRLYLDFHDRSPLRTELDEAAAWSLEDRWIQIAGPEFHRFDGTEPAAIFRRLLGRQPREEEHAALLELAKNDPEQYAFLLCSSTEYARPPTPRERTHRQLARSLVVDLLGRRPSASDEAELIRRVEAAKDTDWERFVRELSNRPDSTARAPDDDARAWIRAAYLCMVLRAPLDTELTAAEAGLRHDPDSWRYVLRDLAGREAYREY